MWEADIIITATIGIVAIIIILYLLATDAFVSKNTITKSMLDSIKQFQTRLMEFGNSDIRHSSEGAIYELEKKYGEEGTAHIICRYLRSIDTPLERGRTAYILYWLGSYGGSRFSELIEYMNPIYALEHSVDLYKLEIRSLQNRKLSGGECVVVPLGIILFPIFLPFWLNEVISFNNREKQDRIHYIALGNIIADCKDDMMVLKIINGFKSIK